MVADGPYSVVYLCGEVDQSNCSHLHDALRATSSAQVVVIDCAGLAFIDSRGICAILDACSTAPWLRLRNAPPVTARLLNILGMGDLLMAS